MNDDDAPIKEVSDLRLVNVQERNLLLVQSNPVGVGEPLVLFDVGYAVLEIPVALRQVNLQLVAQQIFYVGTEMRRKSHLSHDKQYLPQTICSARFGLGGAL